MTLNLQHLFAKERVVCHNGCRPTHLNSLSNQ
jgi:hypothetical protein